jgi:hypothetical protein
MVLDAGDGRPTGDGPYRKDTLGPAPHQGAVYVVAGSSSDVRPANLNHPVMEIGLEEYGSLVVDVDGDTLTGTFVNRDVQTTDGFTIVKDPDCPAAPRTGCTASARGSLLVRDEADDTRDKLYWRWKGAALDPAEVGAPDVQTDLALCVYDQNGALLSAALPRGADAPGKWIPINGGIRYFDKSATEAGLRKVDIRLGGRLLVDARGPALGTPSLPLTPPVTAQLVNLDNQACWESMFATASKNGPTKAVLP